MYRYRHACRKRLVSPRPLSVNCGAKWCLCRLAGCTRCLVLNNTRKLWLLTYAVLSIVFTGNTHFVFILWKSQQDRDGTTIDKQSRQLATALYSPSIFSSCAALRELVIAPALPLQSIVMSALPTCTVNRCFDMHKSRTKSKSNCKHAAPVLSN